ncbi:glycine cleavage system aminomethyltransferase GcvT [Metabacillus litoralis]|uniref:glycine cleavage system aminomethyltransferase GcvT n=1 Tax=Metabacillus litoralis TaxID=152268 RepID=UPI00203E9580|nr:glycine cleavage system aminomethyltransferase GcvT [Metabacillus litoralis]MCM3413158.1 glycine cleavage system aminomethyltransferase GcvT [Metabacillus litoralis]
MSGSQVTLRKTPLFPLYEGSGAKVIDFGGWALPVHFSSILEEHHAVRTAVGLFDVSHMGEILVEGRGAENYVNYLITNDATKLKVNQVQYTAMCYPDGSTVDDILIYKLAEEKFLFVVNAANIKKDFNWMELYIADYVRITNISDSIALLALQGPRAERVLQKLTHFNLKNIDYFGFAQQVNIAGVNIEIVSRTGYTGEDGFELYLDVKNAKALWGKIVEAGTEDGLKLCGLGARDTLRLEARLPLYGQELSNQITPLEAGIGFAVKTNKESDFLGKEALTIQKEQGLRRKIVGIEISGRGIPRHGYKVFTEDGDEIGVVTSGTQSPTLKKSVGLALLDKDYSGIGTRLKVEIRNRKVEAYVVKAPFYKRV